MRFTTLTKIALFTLLISGCGTSEMDHWVKTHNDPCDLGMVNCTNTNSSGNSTTPTETTINDNLTNDVNTTPEDTNITNDTNTTPEDTNTTNDINTTTEETNITNSEIEVDPNACSSNFSAIEDTNNDPQGKSADGITFTNFLSDPNTVLIFYYEKADILNNERINFDKYFNDKNGNVNFMLSIDSAYAGKGYFYVKNSSNNRCFRGEFPKDQFSAPNYTLVEVKEK